MLSTLVQKIDSNEISGKIAKEVFDEMFESGKEPDEIIKEKGLALITDTTELENIIDEVIKSNEGPVNDYRAGKQQAFGFLIGQIMAKTKGQANPKAVNEILREKLK
jgi:aspartyl-tRNA(Asn)/glutamyl-tRNA(Gln) amidotransferase subunit B